MKNNDRLVAKVIAQTLNPKVRHYWGMPQDLSDGGNPREEMPCAIVLLIEAKPDGVFLTRFSADGREVGDTWHQSIEEAQEQAAFEFDKKLSNWVVVPPRGIDSFFP
jgi:hypothetical protein